MVLVGASVVLAACQGSLLYYPHRVSAAVNAGQVHSAFDGGARLLPGFDAIVIDPPDRAVRATAVWFHGNAGSAVDRAWAAETFAARGLRLVLAEYPGYAARPGRPSEDVLVEDARALVGRLREEFPAQPLLLVGESLGAAVAIQAAQGLGPAPARLVLLAPFANLAQAARRHVGALPVGWLLGDRYESDRHLHGWHAAPVAILVAGRDEVVGPEGGRQLFDIARTTAEAQLVELPRAGHNDWPRHITEAQWTVLLGHAPVR